MSDGKIDSSTQRKRRILARRIFEWAFKRLNHAQQMERSRIRTRKSTENHPTQMIWQLGKTIWKIRLSNKNERWMGKPKYLREKHGQINKAFWSTEDGKLRPTLPHVLHVVTNTPTRVKTLEYIPTSDTDTTKGENPDTKLSTPHVSRLTRYI